MNKYPQRRETWQASNSLKHKPDSNKSFDRIPVLYKVLPSFLWSIWEYLGMETDSHATHFAASTYQIGLILQVQNHFPTKCRAAAPARALSQPLHWDSLPAPLSHPTHTTPAPCPAVRTQGCPPCPAVPPPLNQLSPASSAITLQLPGTQCMQKRASSHLGPG